MLFLSYEFRYITIQVSKVLPYPYAHFLGAEPVRSSIPAKGPVLDRCGYHIHRHITKFSFDVLTHASDVEWRRSSSFKGQGNRLLDLVRDLGLIA